MLKFKARFLGRS